jgi:hypothetical protein
MVWLLKGWPLLLQVFLAKNTANTTVCRGLKINLSLLFHIHSVHLAIIKVVYSPTDAQLNCLKNNFKIHTKIDIKTAPTCFGVIIIIRERIIRAC